MEFGKAYCHKRIIRKFILYFFQALYNLLYFFEVYTNFWNLNLEKKEFRKEKLMSSFGPQSAQGLALPAWPNGRSG
jgi:hypothetical protein